MEFTLDQAIDEIREHPAKAREMYERVIHEDLLHTPIREGSWTPQQIFHHLADSHINSYIRIKLALTEDRPTIKPYDQEAWAELEDVRTVPVTISLDLLNYLHHRCVALLEYLKENSPESFERIFVHPEVGELTLKEYIITSFAKHGISHLSGIEKLITGS